MERRRFPWGKTSIEEELQLCSDEPIPYIFDRCENGYYVSVPFTAREYFVLYQPNEFKAIKKYYFYRVEYTDDETFEPDFDPYYEDSVISILQGINQSKITEIKKLIPTRNTIEIKSLEPAPSDRSTVYNLIGKRSVTLFPSGEVNSELGEVGKKIIEGKTENILSYIHTEKVEIPLGNEKIVVLVPRVPVFDTDLYWKTASIEIYDHRSAVPLLRHLYVYNKFRVSRPVVYTGS